MGWMILIPIAVTIISALCASVLAADSSASYGGDIIGVMGFLVALVISLATWLGWAVLT